MGLYGFPVIASVFLHRLYSDDYYAPLSLGTPPTPSHINESAFMLARGSLDLLPEQLGAFAACRSPSIRGKRLSPCVADKHQSISSRVKRHNLLLLRFLLARMEPAGIRPIIILALKMRSFLEANRTSDGSHTRTAQSELPCDYISFAAIRVAASWAELQMPSVFATLALTLERPVSSQHNAQRKPNQSLVLKSSKYVLVKDEITASSSRRCLPRAASPRSCYRSTASPAWRRPCSLLSSLL